jgi:bifunctional non-homologous end joining protein LigD
MVQVGNRNPEPIPRFIEPMQCARVERLPEGDDWVYEIKHDGYRAIGLVDGGSAMLYSMSGLDYSTEFAHITFALGSLGAGNLVLDGEIVALDESGRASFQELQNRKNGGRPVVYYIFDVLHRNKRDTLQLPLFERKAILDEVARRFSDPLRLNPIFQGKLAPLVVQVKTSGFGISSSASLCPDSPVTDSQNKLLSHRIAQRSFMQVSERIGDTLTHSLTPTCSG